jgi:hypothetical protein
MQDLRKERQKNLIAWKKFQLNVLKFRFWIIKKKWWILLFLIALSFFIFPTQIGTAIGTWITDFLGSIIKNIQI